MNSDSIVPVGRLEPPPGRIVVAEERLRWRVDRFLIALGAFCLIASVLLAIDAFHPPLRWAPWNQLISLLQFYTAVWTIRSGLSRDVSRVVAD